MALAYRSAVATPPTIAGVDVENVPPDEVNVTADPAAASATG